MTNYSINKEDLHNLLRAVGVLQENETLLFVNNFDLTDTAERSVVVSVLDKSDPDIPEHTIEQWSDKDIHNRFMQLAALEVALHDQKNRLVAEFERLLKEVDRRTAEKSAFSLNDVPERVQEELNTQLKSILDRTSGELGGA